jgi:hypothetical protein
MANLNCVKWFACGAVFASTLTGCGPEFDPASKLQSLRILAVKKDDPYARVVPPADSASVEGVYQPDNEVSVSVAFEDARRKEDRLGSLQKLWFSGCSNPFGDRYFACMPLVWLTFKAFESLHPEPLKDGESWGLTDVENPDDVAKFVSETFPAQGTGGKNNLSSLTEKEQAMLLEQAMVLRVGAGNSYRYELPPWLIERHTPSSDPDIPNYGLSQVYFALCDGEIGLAEPWQGEIDLFTVMADATMGFPLTCYEPGSTKERGPDHFMVSYSNVYAYEKLSNQNPVIDGIQLGDEEIPRSALCIGESCDPDQDACKLPNVKHVPRCTEENSSSCKKYALKPLLDEKKNSEIDEVASSAGGRRRKLREQMWLRYYATRGNIKFEVKRLQDANEGWFEDHGTEWTLPRTPGSVMIWSVAYDNRGGVDWVRLPVCVD